MYPLAIRCFDGRGMTPVIELYHDSLREGGIDNVNEIYTRAQELVAEYQADYEASH